ncbi:MAG: hypothetical protein A4E73_01185 [Syntrophaceae bacterium PtaU1.Bin231]|nr:MAG: hypothetical protein A4E73_01185 [Syntrophaceae bacterium PtaU1.Bin231]HOG18490.1 hypothetical protein [Syntrophales bacterium]
MGNFRQVEPGRKPFKRAYLAVMLWFVGRSIPIAAKIDPAIAKEIAGLPEGFTFSLGVLPAGPAMIVGKDASGRARYLGLRPEGRKIDLSLKIRNIEAAIGMFTFREGTAVATARNRLIVDGEVPHACVVVRILDAVEVYLLFKVIARLAVKRYPDWPMGRILWGRFRIYLGAVLGF